MTDSVIRDATVYYTVRCSLESPFVPLVGWLRGE